ncbi:hypothetical protein GCM10022253_29940 [Sphingomonas endophytica]|uniref:Filamentous hemagglutinin family protein n=1 Tax=Sphingomonas endophytica TaxID=869719 RepID=A0ABR6N8U8_9SPHN|nr:filamentous hemagglutinin family protein [Sphingomonas endophytica]
MATALDFAPRSARRGALRALLLSVLATSALSPARAQNTVAVATPPLQPANSRTGLDVTPGGTPIVNIATPDANGTSYNLFTRLSVGKEGLIFDNSPTTGKSAIGGLLLANPNLTGGKAASLILNEVTGGVRTTLAGPVEIFGQRAALVIANPTGITCDGCGFVNTSRVSLAAATLRFAADGSFSGFRLAEGGDVTLAGQGLLAGNVDYFDIIAAATHINASLYAKDLLVAGGSGTVDYASRTAAAEGETQRSGVAIDSALLGGMYADRIRLIGTGAGLGINLQGTVASLDGPLIITGDGAIALAATTSSGDATVTTTQGAITLGDRTYAGGKLRLAGQTIRQQGGFAGALEGVALEAAGGVSFEGGKGVYAGLDGKGELSGTGALSIDAGGVVEAGSATLAAGGGLRIDALAVRQATGGRIGGADITIQTFAEQTLSGAINTGGTARLEGDVLRLAGTLGANGGLVLSGRQVVVAGTVTAPGSATGNASEGFSVLAGGVLQSGGLASLTAPTLDLAGTVSGGSGVSLRATTLTTSGTIRAGGDLVVSAAGDAALGGNWTATGDGTLGIAGDASVAGSMAVAKALAIRAGALNIGGAVQAGGVAALASVGDLTTQAGAKLLANGAVDISAGGSIALGGQIGGNDTLNIRAAGVLDAGDATLVASGALSLTGGALRQGASGQIVGEQVTLDTSGEQMLAGTINARGDAMLRGDIINVSGTLGAQHDLTLSGRRLLVSGTATGLASAALEADEALSVKAGGIVQTGGIAALNAPVLDLAGTVLGRAGITALARTLTSSGTVRSGSDLAVTTDGDATLDGGWAASGNAAFAVTGKADLAATLLAGKALSIRADKLVLGGSVQAGETLSLQAIGDLTTAGATKILAGRAAALTAGGAVSLSGTIGSNDTLSIQAKGAIDTGEAALTAIGALRLEGASTQQGTRGQIAAAHVTLNAGGEQLLAGTIGARGDAMLKGDVIDLSGTLGAQHDLVLSGRRLRVSGTATGLASAALEADEVLSIQAGGAVQTGGVAVLGAPTLDLAGTVLGRAGVTALAATLTSSGTVRSEGDLSIAASGSANLSGTLATAKALTIRAGDVTVGGTVQAGDTLSVTTAGDLAATGDARIFANGAVTLIGGGNVALAGEMGANDVLSIRAAALLDTGSAAIAATGALRLEGGALRQGEGGDIAGAGVTLTAQGGQALAGTIRSSGDVTLRADTIRLTGEIGAEGQLSLAGRRLLLGGTATGLASATAEAGEWLSIAAGGALQTNGRAGIVAPMLDLAGTLLGGSGVTARGTTLTGSGSVESGGDLTVTVAGDAALGGSLIANGALALVAGGDLTLSGTAQTRGRLSLGAATLHLTGEALTALDGEVSVARAAEIGGILSAAGDLTLTAPTLSTAHTAQLLAGKAFTLDTPGLFEHRGVLNAGAITIAADALANSGTMVAAGDLGVVAGTRIAQDGAMQAGGTLALDAALVTLSGSTSGGVGGAAGTGVTIHAPVLAFTAESDLQSGAALEIAGTADFVTRGRIVALGAARITSAGALTQAATASGNGAFDLAAGTTLDQTGVLAALGPVSLTAPVLRNSGSIGSDAGLTLAATTAILSSGSLQTGGALRLSAPTLGLAGPTASNGMLYLAGDSVTLAGTVAGLQGIDARIGELTLGSGAALQSGAALRLDLARLDNAGLIASDQALTLATTVGFASRGQIAAGGDLGLTVAGDLFSTGLLQAAGDLELRATGIASLAGAVRAGGKALLAAAGLRSAAVISAQGALDVSTPGDVTLTAGSTSYAKGALTLSTANLSALGGIRSDAGLTLTASQALTLAGRIEARDATEITAGADAVLGGTLASGGALRLTAPTVSIPGQILANHAVSITANADTLSLTGTIQATSDVALRAITRLRIGAPVSTGSTEVSAAGTLPSNGTGKAGGDVPAGGDSGGSPASGGDHGGAPVLATPSADATPPALLAISVPALAGVMMPGSLAAGGAVTLSAAEIEIAGTIAAKGDLTAWADHVLTVRGGAWSDHALTVTSDSVTVASLGRLAAAGPVAITSRSGLGNAGTIASNAGALTLDVGGALDQSGTLSAGTDLRVRAGADMVTAGTVSAATIAIDARDLTLGGTMVGVDSLRLGGRTLTLGEGSDMQGGRVDLASSDATTLDGKLLATGGLSVTAGTMLALGAGADVHADGTIGLTTAGDLASAAGSKLVAIGAAALKADRLALAGTITGNDTLDLTAAHDLALSGATMSLGNLSVVGGATNVSGSLATGARLTVTGGATTLAAASTLQAGEALSLSAATLSGDGRIQSRGNLTIDSADAARLAGTLTAGTIDGEGHLLTRGNLVVTSKGALELAADASVTGTARLAAQGLTLGGTLVGLGDLSLHAASLATSGTVKAQGAIVATIAGDAMLGGALTGLGGMAITSGGALVQNAALASNSTLRLVAGGALTYGGTSNALGDMQLTGAGLSLDGTIRGNGALSLVSTRDDILLAQGAQVAARSIDLHAAGKATLAGTLVAASALAVRANAGLTVAATGALQAGVSATDGQSGSIGTLTLTAGDTLDNAGSLAATGSLTATAQTLSSTGTLFGSGVDLSAGSATIGGSVFAPGTVSIRTASGALALSGIVEGGTIAVSARGGDLGLSTDARLTATGTGEDGTLSLTGSGNIEMRGVLAANNTVTLDAGGSLYVGADRAGTTPLLAVSTLGNATLRAGAGLVNDGTVAGASLSITAARLDSNHLSATGGIVADIAGGITLRGTTNARGAAGVALAARGGDLALAGGAKVEAAGTVALSATGALTNQGAIVAGTVGDGGPEGSITLTSGGALIFTGAIISNNGAVTLGGASLTLGGALGQDGGVYAAGTLTLNAPAVTLLAGGQAVANGGLAASVTSLTLGAGSLLQSNRDIALTLGDANTAGSYVSAGDLVALGDLSLGVNGGAIGNQAGGGIFAGGSGAAAGGGSITLRADTIANAGAIVATAATDGSGGKMSLTASGITDAGLLHADRTLAVTASSVTISGAAEAGDAIAWSIPTLSVTSGGVVKSAGAIALSGASFANGGMVAAGGDLAITTSGDLTSSGALTARGAIALQSGTVLTLAATSGTWAGGVQDTPAIDGGNVTLRAASAASLGTLSATGSLGITADAATIGGASVANGDITLAGYGGDRSALTVTAGGTLTSYLGDVKLGKLSGLNLAGALVATHGGIAFSAGGTSIGATGRLAAGQDVAITTTGGGALTIDGQLVAGNDLSLSGGTLAIGGSGFVQAGRDLAFDTGDMANDTGTVTVNGIDYERSSLPVAARLAGKISAGRDLRLSMTGALVAERSAQLIAGNDMTLSAAPALIDARYTVDSAGNPLTLGVIAGHDLRFTSSTNPVILQGEPGLMLTGSMQAGNDLSVQVSGEVNSTAASQFVAGVHLALTGSALRLAGFNSGQNQVSLTATGVPPTLLAAEGDPSAVPPGSVTLAGATTSNGRISVTAATATVTASGSLTARGGAANATALGRDIGAQANIDLETGGALTNNGAIWSDGVIFLKSSSSDIVNDATGTNGGITARTLAIQADHGQFYQSAGAFKADDTGLFLGGDLVNSGSLAPSGNFRIEATNIRNSGLLATSGNLTLLASGDLYNVGTLFAGQTMSLTAGGALTNDYVGDDQGNGAHGSILAQGDIAITAHDVLNQSATIQSLAAGISINLSGGELLNSIKYIMLRSAKAGKVLRDSEPIYCKGLGLRSTCSPSADPDEEPQKNVILAEKNSGSSKIVSNNSIDIGGGNGNVINRNSSILAGGNISISSTAKVDNVSDLLVENSGSTAINTIIPGAPTIIQAGGTVTINTKNFNNIANNLVGADTFTAKQRVEHVAPNATSQTTPQTGSTGNGASAVASITSAAATGSVAVLGSAAAGRNDRGWFAREGRGSRTRAALATDDVSITGTHAAGSGRNLALKTQSASAAGPIAAGNSIDLGGVAGAQVVGTVRAGSDGVAAAEFSSTPVSGAVLAAGGAIAISTGSGADRVVSGMLSAALDARSALAVDAGGMHPGGAIPSVGQGVGPVSSGKVDTATFSTVALSGAATVAPGLLAPVPGIDVSLPSAATIVHGLVSSLNDADAPTLADQGFGTFLGGFLAGFNLTGNTPSLFTYNANPDSAALFHSAAGLSSEADLYDSAWFFKHFTPDRPTTYTRLGDGFFEALLVSREVQAATGQAQLKQFGSVLDQYQGLLKNAEQAREGLGLQLGVALTPAQVAALTEPLVWYVHSQVEGRDVLVPVVYLAAGDPKAINGGALVGGNNVAITASDGITNSGTIQAKNIAALAAKGGDLVNAGGGTISGGTVLASAGRDLVNASGATIRGGEVIARAARDVRLAGGSTIHADAGLGLDAGRDVTTTTVSTTSASATSSYRDGRHWSNSYKVTEQVTGASITSGGEMTIHAGRNLNLNAATLTAGGAAQLAAVGDVTLGGTSATTTTSTSARTGKYINATSTMTETRFVGTSVTAAGPITVVAGGKLTVTGGTVQTTDPAAGGITFYGAQGISLLAAEEHATLRLSEQTGKKSHSDTTASSTTHQLANIDAAGGIALVSLGAVQVAGANVTGQGKLVVDAASLNVTGVIDTVDSRVDTVSRRSGLFSSTTRRGSTTSHNETAVASTLSGDTGEVTTTGAVTITGANVVGAHGLNLSAGGPVTIGALATTNTEQRSSSVKKSGFSLGGGGLFLGVAKTSTTGGVTDVTQTGSVVGSGSGKVTIRSAGALNITGSTVAGSDGLLLQGKSVRIDDALETRDSNSTTKTSSIGVTLGAQGQLVQSATNLVGMVKLAGSTRNERVAAVAGLAGGTAAVNTYNAAADLADTLKSGKGDLGVAVGASFGISRSRATDSAHGETVAGSTIRGHDVTIVADGAGADGTIEIRGSSLDVGHDLTLAANGGITLAAATETDRQSGTSRSSGVTLGATWKLGLDKGKPGLGGPTVSLGVSASNGSYSGSETYNAETVLSAGGTTTLLTPGALTLDGAVVRGARVESDVGSLTITSLQDTSSYQSRSTSVSAGVSVGPGGQVSVSGNLSNGRQQGDFASVAEQAGIFAGDQGFGLRVAGDTSLTGAVIASTADPSKNSLTTGTLHAVDLENHESWRASQTSLGGGLGGLGADRQGRADPNGATPLPGVQVGGLGTLTATAPLAMGAGDGQAGVTRSAIAPGAITITSGDAASQRTADILSRDTQGANAGALVQQFTDAKRQEIAEGFQAAQVLAAETNAFLSTQSAKADQWTRTHPDEDAKSNPYALWGAGGTGRLAFTAINGAAGSDIGGSLGGLVRGAIVNVAQQEGARLIGEVAHRHDDFGTAVEVAGLHGLLGCAGAIAAGGNCNAGAAGGAGASLIGDVVTRVAPTATMADKQAAARLIETVVTGAASAAGLDPATVATSAAGEVYNNTLGPRGQALYEKLLAGCTTEKCKQSIESRFQRYKDAPETYDDFRLVPGSDPALDGYDCAKGACLESAAPQAGAAASAAVSGVQAQQHHGIASGTRDGETKPALAEGAQPAASLPDASATGLLEGLVGSESPDQVAALARLPGGQLFAPYVEPIRRATEVTTSAPEGFGTVAGAGLLAGGIVANAVAPLVTTAPDSDGAANAATPPLNTVEVTSGGKGGWSKELNNPAPNTIYKVDGAFTYTTDELGRVRQVEATLSRETSEGDRNNHQQCKAGKCGLDKDEGGHLIATVLGGPGEAINLVPMDANLNRRA